MRPLPATVDSRAEVSAWKGEARTAAIAAAGGLVAGAATVADRPCNARRLVRRSPRAGARSQGPPGEGPGEPLLPRRRPPHRPLAVAVRGVVGPLDVEVKPAWPYRLRSRLGADWTARRRGAVVTRLLSTPEGRVVVHAWQPRSESVCLRAASADADAPATRRRARARDRADALRARRRRRLLRVRADVPRRPADRRRDPPPALVSAEAPPVAVGGAGVGGDRAADRGAPRRRDPAPDRPALGRAAAARRRVRRATAAWLGPGPLRDVPSAAVVAGIAPAELESCDLAAKRAIALIHCAREVAAGRVDPATPRATRACCGSPTSDPGRFRSSASTAAATPTRCRPATSPTSSSWAPWPASAAAPRWMRSRSTSPPTRRSGPRRGIRADPLARRGRLGPAAEARGVAPNLSALVDAAGSGWVGWRDQAWRSSHDCRYRIATAVPPPLPARAAEIGASRDLAGSSSV